MCVFLFFLLAVDDDDESPVGCKIKISGLYSIKCGVNRFG